MLAAIDFQGLGQVIWVSAVAGVAVTVLYSVAIFGLDKASEARRGGQGGASVAYSALAVVALLVFGGSIVIALIVMFKKA
jgi:hypothetical protein